MSDDGAYREVSWKLPKISRRTELTILFWLAGLAAAASGAPWYCWEGLIWTPTIFNALRGLYRRLRQASP